MKTGCLYAFLAVVGAFVVSLLMLFALQAIVPASIKVNPEGIGRIVGFFIWVFIAPAAFIYGYRRQRRFKSIKTLPAENLRSIDFASLRKTIQSRSSSTDNDHNA